MLDLLAPLFVGLAGSLHCVGMCGPIVVAYSLQAKPGPNSALATARASLSHHLAFHAGRIVSYSLLGAVAGVVAQLVNLQVFMGHLRSFVSIVAGMILVIFGLVLLRVLLAPSWTQAPSFQSASGPSAWIARGLSSQSLLDRFVLGMATGFLPCMLPWAMMVKAASSSGMGQALATMLLFGLGTIPALLLIGTSATAVSGKLRIAGERVAAVSLILMGSILLFKGARALFRLHGCLA